MWGTVGNTTTRAQYVRSVDDGLARCDNFQDAGVEISTQLGKCEDDIIKAYSELGTATTDQEIRAKEATVQKLNIKLKRLQNMMELFQQVVKSHYEIVQRAIMNINVRS